MKPSRRIDEPPLRTIDPNEVVHTRSEEMLVADKRAGLTPADLVEQRFQALLRGGSSLTPDMPWLGLSRTDGRTRRAVQYAPSRRPTEMPGRGEVHPGHGESTMYAISIEQSQATEILARLQPWPCRFWQTGHRGLLLIHARPPKLAREVSAFTREPRGNALVGVVDLIDCIPSTRLGDDPDEIEYHWLLANPHTFAQPVPYTGRLGLFLVSEKVAAAALRQLGTSRRPHGA